MLRYVLLAFGAVAGSYAQTPISILGALCPGSEARIPMVYPVTVGSQTVITPVCAKLGAGLTLNTATMTLEARAAAAIPRRHVQTVTLQAFPATQLTWSFNLAHTPVLGGDLLFFYNSSLGAANVSGSITIVTSSNLKTLILTLPIFRPFSGGDTITFNYPTWEAAI